MLQRYIMTVHLQRFFFINLDNIVKNKYNFVLTRSATFGFYDWRSF